MSLPAHEMNDHLVDHAGGDTELSEQAVSHAFLLKLNFK